MKDGKNMINILIIEDDENIREELTTLLRKNNYQVSCITDFKHPLENIYQGDYQLLLLDITLPNQNGFEICQRIKKELDIPIIFVTSSNRPEDELKSILSGGDDFITKPYHVSLLLEKIKRATKKKDPLNNQILKVKNVIYDMSTSLLSYQDKNVELTRNERKIIYYLFQNADRLVTKDELIEYLWNDKYYLDENILIVNMNRLRKKLKEIGLDNFIQTISSTGNSYNVEMEVQVLDDNPGKKVTEAEYTKVGENYYYSEYTTQILDEINSDAGAMYLKQGDMVTVSVKNTNRTIGTILRDFFYSVTGNNSATVTASHSGIVNVNGR